MSFQTNLEELKRKLIAEGWIFKQGSNQERGDSMKYVYPAILYPDDGYISALHNKKAPSS